eukprot:gene13497-28627_t
MIKLVSIILGPVLVNCFMGSFKYDHLRIKTNSIHPQISNRMSSEDKSVDLQSDAIFGAEFRKNTEKPLAYEEQIYWKGKAYVKKAVAPEKVFKSKDEYERLRVTFLFDSVYVSLLGLCLAWFFGTYKDAFSYGVGSLLGLGYAILLGRYVQSIGTGSGGVGGPARFAPVFLLVLLYSKNKETISIIPEIIGFFSYQLGSLLQIFNTNAYGEDDMSSDQ